MAKTTQSRVVDELQSCSDADKAKTLARFFKTGKGEYGEGDTFLGVVVPDIRRVAKKYYAAESLTSIGSLLRSRYHEVRLVALIMMVYKYQRAKNPEHRAEIFDFYISHTQYINNWDLVDLTAPNIVGDYLLKNSNVKALRQELRTQADPLWCTKCFRRKMTNTALSQRLIRLGRKNSKPKTKSSGSSLKTKHSKRGTRHLDLDPLLITFAQSASLWDRRIAILSTFSFIRAGRHQEAFAIAELLLHDTHDLIHKAVGWMLREVGKRVGKDVLRTFLDEHARTMPRTALRYTIEHLDAQERKHYMNFKNS